MSGEFWVGLLSVPALTAALLILWLLFSLASNAWDKLHRKLLLKVDLKANLTKVHFRGDQTPRPAPRPKYEDSANHIRDALLRSPRIYSVTGLGWNVALVRDIKNEPEMDR